MAERVIDTSPSHERLRFVKRCGQDDLHESGSSRANNCLYGTGRQELHRFLIGDNRLFCAPKPIGQIIFQPRAKPGADRLTVSVAAYPTAANSSWHAKMDKHDQYHRRKRMRPIHLLTSRNSIEKEERSAGIRIWWCARPGSSAA